MTFVSIQEQDFLTSILKTWITLFSSDTAFWKVKVLPKFPDKDIEAKLPCIVVRRVSDDKWRLLRNSGYFWNIEGATPEEIWRLHWYTYLAMYQFDIYATTIESMTQIASKVFAKLKSPDNSDVFADFRVWESCITLKDFSSVLTGTNTNLKMKYRFNRDVESAEIDPFDTELHQYSISVYFRLDYLKEYDVPIITTISPSYTLIP